MPAATPSGLARAAVLAFAALLNAAVVPLPAADAEEQAQSSETVRLAVGASSVISLQENPSTGYRWHVDTAESTGLGRIVQVSDAGFQPGPNALVGAPGRHLWRFEGFAAGSAQVVLAYSRPWEKVPPAGRHTVTVAVSPRQ